MQDLTELMRTTMVRKPKVVAKTTIAPVLDAVEEDSNLPGYTETDVRLKSIAAVNQWLETEDLDEGESLADRLFAMMVGIADSNQDGEIDDDEQAIIDMALNDAWDYLSSKGVTDDDCSALLNDWDDDAATRILDLVLSNVGENEIDNFVFGASDQEPLLDAVYKKAIAVRNGKKVRINKRIAGTVRLSAKQKVAIKRMHMKSHNAAAQMHRAKSNRVRTRYGL